VNQEAEGRHSGTGATILGLFGVKGPPRPLRRRSSHDCVHIASGVEEQANYSRVSGIEVGFLRLLRFPLLILIPPTVPQSASSIVRGWYNRSISGRRTTWTHSHPNPPTKKKTSRVNANGIKLM
jgi:hypothetical protein